jgi:release factor glutamine methyltransferase
MATTRALLDEGVTRLRDAGMETPRLDAELLLGHALGVDRTAVVAHADAPVGDGAAAAYREFVERRATGEPVAYIRGLKEFHGIAFAVDPRALIPRPETELLVDIAVAEVMRRLVADGGRGGRPPLRVLDVGTGSGAIAVALAVALRTKRVPPEEVEITAVDISPEALDVARENAVGHAVGDRLLFATADLVPPLDHDGWAIVAANLPYVRTDALAGLPAPTTFEPAIALDGGADGLDVVRRLIDVLPRILQPGGLAVLEIGSDQEAAITDLVGARLEAWTCVIEHDLSGLPRVVRLGRPA